MRGPVRKKVGAVVAAVLSMAMVCGFTGVSIADDTVTGGSDAVTSQTDDTNSSATDTADTDDPATDSADHSNIDENATNNGTPPLNENSQQQADSSNSGEEAGTQQSDTSSADTSNAAQPNGTAAPAATGDCAAVTDWATLKNCVETGTDDVTVTITAPITAAKGESIIVTRNVTLTSTVTEGTSLKPADGDTGDSLFTIGDTNGKIGSLTIGANADEKFSYSGTAAAPIARRFVTVRKGSTLTINGGTFSYLDITKSVNNNKGSVIYSGGGTVTIANGVFNYNVADNGGVIYEDSGYTTIAGGTFSNNSAQVGGVITQQNNVSDTEKSSVDISGGRFTGNRSLKTGTSWNGGGVIRSRSGSVTIESGDFENNMSLGSGGGAIYQIQGKTTIKGGTFESNRQTYAEVNATGVITAYIDCSAEKDIRNCKKSGARGGGAIHVDGNGYLAIQGNVEFSKNYAKEWAYMSGGGAVYVQGTLWVRNGVDGTRPLFRNNWAGVLDTQYPQAGSWMSTKQTPVGGAGGAIFLQNGGSTGYIMGGTFTDNTSGYLGGAVYTESDSTTYIAKAAATSNTAGHFGGGFWLCPSGNGEASKGGNIALYDNSVDNTVDPNVANLTPYEGGDMTMAGSDFAIMNPYTKKDEVDENKFQLMDTWFTDRTESAVSWTQDGTPVTNANGFGDSWQGRPTGWINGGSEAVTANKTENSSTLLAAPDGTPVDFAKNDHMYELKLSYKGSSKYDDKNRTQYLTGVALKANVLGKNAAEIAAKKNGAWSSAAVRFTGNKARLSGGAFGTNGNVLFSTPWVASWSKVADTKNDQGQYVPDESKPLAGSEWLVESEPLNSDITVDNGNGKNVTLTAGQIGGPLNEDFYPTICATVTDKETGKISTTRQGEADWSDGICWKNEYAEDGKTLLKRSAIIKDNIANDDNVPENYSYSGMDNNPSPGGFDINNLANGSYNVTEYHSPAGYRPIATTFVFAVADGQARWNTKIKANEESVAGSATDLTIGNMPLPGVSWSKRDADYLNDRVKGTEWKITPIDDTGTVITGGTVYTVKDCEDTTDEQTGTVISCADGRNKDSTHVLADTDGDPGDITVDGIPAGRYRLDESNVPDGYWKPKDTGYYWFTIVTGSTDSAQLRRHENAQTDWSKERLVLFSWVSWWALVVGCRGRRIGA